jgi:hypothetical protein
VSVEDETMTARQKIEVARADIERLVRVADLHLANAMLATERDEVTAHLGLAFDEMEKALVRLERLRLFGGKLEGRMPDTTRAPVVSPLLADTLGTWCVLRNLFQFTPEELFLQTSRSVVALGALSAFVVAERGGLSFSVEVGVIPQGDGEAFIAAYEEAGRAMAARAIPEEVVRGWMRGSEAYRRWPELMMALVAKGFLVTRPSAASLN